VSAELRQLGEGRIVWAIVRDHNGFRKRRPAIILTSTAEIAADQPLVLMAITTTYTDPAPPDCIELPWNPDRRRTSTGLARRSAAVVSWLDTIYPDEVEGFIGMVPPNRMAEIRRRLAALQ
jgi:mRNA-degrading endonuclease toxin of MazEF toxin-antitoxin module